jgi:predicted nucleic acid-binding protein
LSLLFVDSSAFVALVDQGDKNHSRAARFLKSLSRARRPLITSTDVADEVITLVRMRLGHPVAVRAGEAILESSWCRLLEIDAALREGAWRIFKRFDDQTFSFTDCTSLAIMTALDIGEAFTFDRRDFGAAGFTALPAPQ